jgi:hypothetical protein
MSNITFITKIDEKGGLDFGSFHNLARFRQWCKENIGRTVRIEPQVLTRSLSQNALYHLYLDVIERETGNNHNDLHEFFKREFLQPKIIKLRIEGKDIERKIPASTTELNKIDFADYLDKICAMTSVPIPDSEAYLAEIDLAPTK